MTSKLLIAYPDIQAAALDTTSDGTYAEDTPLQNTFYGMRHCIGQLATAAADHYALWDLGLGVTQSANYIIFARADVLKTQGVPSIVLKGHTGTRVNATTGTTVWSNALFTGETLVGPQANDYVATFTASTAFRYWWINFTAATTAKFGRSKNYIGTFLDLGEDPDSFSYSLLQDNSGELAFPTGQVRMTRIAEPRRTFEINWTGISDANAQLFAEKVLADPWRRYVYLYATNTQILGGQSLVHCRVVPEQCAIRKSNKKDWAYIRGVFEEVIG